MELRLDFKNLVTRRNTDEIELLSPRETPSNLNRKSLNGSISARAERGLLLPDVAGEKVPCTSRPFDRESVSKPCIKRKVNKKKAVFQMKTVAVFPSKSSSSEAVSPFPQLKKPQLENKQEKIVEVKVWKPDVHEFTSTSIIEPEASLLDFKLSPFPQRPALKKQDTSVIPDHILLQRLRTKKPDIVFNDSPTKSEYHSASPTTNTRVNSSNQASERNRSPDSSRVDVLPVVDSSIDAFVFSSPQPQQIPSPNPNAAGGQKRINPVLSISPYPAPSSPPRILDASSHATFGNSTEKLKVAGFTIANYAADSSGSKRQHASSSENCTNQEIRNLQGSKVLKVSIPKAAMNTPDREHDGDHRQYVAELASELNNVLISPPISAVDKPVVPAAAINSKGRQELKAPPKPIPVAGQINSPPKAAEIHTVVFSEREDGDGAAFKSHSLADDYLMQLRFHSNFKLDKEKDALRGAGKAVRMAEPQRLAPQVSCQLQELVLPSMPIKPKPQTSFMSVAARRHLALRVGVPAQPASSIKSPSAHSGGAPLPEGNSTAAGSDMLMLKRRVVNDALSGARTGATKGGLFQSAENVDFYDLLNGSASVSVSAEQSRNAHLAHELELQKEREREKILAGEAEAAVKLSCQSNLDPAVQAAIRAAQSVNASLNLLPRALSPLSALDGHAHLLTADEKVEIMAFPKVYFLGQSRDLKPQNVSELDLNGGYDSTGGQYLVAVGDHLRYRYEVLGSLGKGSFGDVFRCRDHKSGIDVAVKVIKNQPIFNAQAEKELAVLNLIRSSDAEAMSLAELGEVPDSKAAATCIDSRADRRQHRHMIQLVDSFEFRHHKCFVFPVCGMNLYEYLKAKDFNGLPMSFVRKVAAQLLDALTHMRSLNVIHCDIKPENILLRNEQCASVVLIDFGSSCIAGQSSFTYIQSRFYRSPEVLLGLPYSFEIDLWSVACILPELRTAFPVFPGESAADQIACISEVLGYPPEPLYQRCPRKERFFDDSGVLIVENSPRGQVRTPCSRSVESISSARRKDAQFVDFVAGCMKWLPEERLPLEQCAVHPWLSEGHRIEEETTADVAVNHARSGTAGEVLRASRVPLLDAPVPMVGLGEADLINKINESADRARREKLTG